MIAYKNAISRQPTNGVTGLLKINKVKRWAEALAHMLPMLDGALTKIGVQHMKKMGIEFHLECALCSR